MAFDQYGSYIPDEPNVENLAGARMLYNAPLFGAPQLPAWGFSSAVLGNTFGSMPDLPMGYSRHEFNREREMASGQYMSGLGWGAAAVGISLAANYALWGSPVKDLGDSVGKTLQSAVITPARVQAIDAARTARAAVTAAGGSTSEVLAAGRAARMSVMASNSAAVSTAQQVTNVFKAPGMITTGVYTGARQVLSVAGGVAGQGLGTTIGAAFGGATNLSVRAGGHVVSELLNTVTFGASNAVGGAIHDAGGYVADAGTALKESATSTRSAIAAEIKAARAEARAAGAGLEGIVSAGRNAGGGLYNKAARTLAGAQAYGGQALAWGGKLMRSGSIGAAADMLGGAMMAGGATAGAAIGSFVLPVAAEMYAMGKAFDYAGNVYDQYKDKAQLERDMFEKSNRILKFGHADQSMGLAGGFTEGQRAQFQSTIKSMAITSGSKSDMFGMGQWSPFGGQSGFGEKFKELKATFNVGSDMGMFDHVKSFDEFEKKFTSMVQVVDKMSKMIKTSKGQILGMLNSMRSEGFTDVNAAGKNLEFRQYTSQVTGKSLDHTMQASAMMSQAYMQAGLAPETGSVAMQNAMLAVSRAKKAGIIDEKALLRLGGEDAAAAQLATSTLRSAQDPNFKIELMRASDIDASGKMVLNKERLNRNLSAGTNGTLGAREAERARQLLQGGGINKYGVYEQGAWVNDRAAAYTEAMARGEFNDVLEETEFKMTKQNLLSNGQTNMTDEQIMREMYRNKGFKEDLTNVAIAKWQGKLTDQERNDNRAFTQQNIREHNERYGIKEKGIGGKLYAGMANALGTMGAWSSMAYDSITGAFPRDYKSIQREKAANWYAYGSSADEIDAYKGAMIKYESGAKYSGERSANLTDKDLAYAMSIGPNIKTEGGKRLDAISAVEDEIRAGTVEASELKTLESKRMFELSRLGRNAEGYEGPWYSRGREKSQTMAAYLDWDKQSKTKTSTMSKEESAEVDAWNKQISDTQTVRGKMMRMLNHEKVTFSASERKQFGLVQGVVMRAMNAEGISPEQAQRDWSTSIDNSQFTILNANGKEEIIDRQQRVEALAFGDSIAGGQPKEIGREQVTSLSGLLKEMGVESLPTGDWSPLGESGSDKFKKQLEELRPEQAHILQQIMSKEGMRNIADKGLNAKLKFGNEERTLQQWQDYIKTKRNTPDAFPQWLEETVKRSGTTNARGVMREALSTSKRSDMPIKATGSYVGRDALPEPTMGDQLENVLKVMDYAQAKALSGVKGETLQKIQTVGKSILEQKDLSQSAKDFFTQLTSNELNIGKVTTALLGADLTNVKFDRGAFSKLKAEVQAISEGKFEESSLIKGYITTTGGAKKLAETLGLDFNKVMSQATDKQRTAIGQATSIDQLTMTPAGQQLLNSAILKSGQDIKDSKGGDRILKSLEESAVYAGVSSSIKETDIKANKESEEKGTPAGEGTGQITNRSIELLNEAANVLQRLATVMGLVH